MSDDVGRPNALAKMREPFPDHQVGQIDRGNGVVLSYVGHAAITDRLLDADPEWTWKPLALDANGLPAFDRAQNGQPIGLWIVLTVRGVSRLGYGDAGGKSGGNAIKEIIGDGLRNAAMRFGAGLDLWHKGDLHGRDDETRAVAGGRVLPPIDISDPAHLSEIQAKVAAVIATSDRSAGREVWDEISASVFDRRLSEADADRLKDELRSLRVTS